MNIEEALYIEKRIYGTSSCYVYHFKCKDCDKIIKIERKHLNNASGKCRSCCHSYVPYLASYNNFRDSVNRTSIKRNHEREFNISFEQYLEFVKIKKCFYCQNQINWIKKNGKGQYRYNLDRKNSNLGYTIDNVVVCCKKCNYMKNNHYSCEEFIAIINLLKNMRGGSI